MPGRFSLVATQDVLQQSFQAVFDEKTLKPRYNIAPSQMILSVLQDKAQRRRFVWLRWGLIPAWLKKEDIHSRWVNARIESADQKPLFRHAFLHQRCLLVATSFFEWYQRQPYAIHYPQFQPFGMAGIWEHWEDKENNIIDSTATLTTEPDPAIAHLHPRMPLIIQPENYSLWLDPETDISVIKKHLATQSTPPWQFYPVNHVVNNARYDVPECLEPEKNIKA